MPEGDSDQLGIDFSAVPHEHLAGAMPADPVALDDAIAAFYRRFLDDLPEGPACLPDAGVHVFVDHRGAGPCLCKTKTRPPTKGLS